MPVRSKILCTVMAGLFFLLPATGLAESVKIVSIELPPRIDGVLTSGEWDRAARLEIASQIEPVNGAAGTERTEAFLMYDRENLYGLLLQSRSFLAKVSYNRRFQLSFTEGIDCRTITVGRMACERRLPASQMVRTRGIELPLH
jgi:hypothetical protein